MAVNWIEGQFRIATEKKFFNSESGETLAQVSQGCGRCPVPGNVQGQAGKDSEPPDLGEDVPAHCRGGRWTRWHLQVTSKPNCSVILWFYEDTKSTSMNSSMSWFGVVFFFEKFKIPNHGFPHMYNSSSVYRLHGKKTQLVHLTDLTTKTMCHFFMWYQCLLSREKYIHHKNYPVWAMRLENIHCQFFS